MATDAPLLSLVIFLPLVGVFFILITRGDEAQVASNCRWEALVTSVAVFLVSLLIWYNFDPTTADFQMVERVEGLSIEPLAWALAFGACFGGNGTLIGASANIVMASKAEVEGYRISFIEFFKIGFPVMIISVAIVTVYLMILNAIFWQASAGN